MATQTSFTAAPSIATPGMLADCSWNEMINTVVDRSGSTVPPGVVVLRTSGGDFSASPVPSTAIVADDDAILTALATAASTQTLDTEADGVVALGRISPPRKITVTRSSHANQDAVSAVLTYIDKDGIVRTQTLAFADVGGDTFTSTYEASYFVSLVIPAQAGTGGTTKIGLDTNVSLDGGDVLGVSVHTHKALISPSSSDNENYEDEDVMPVLTRGRIYVKCETSFRAGDVPYVRLIAAGAEVYGAIRAHDSDAGDAFPWTKARIITSGSANGFALLEINR